MLHPTLYKCCRGDLDEAKVVASEVDPPPPSSTSIYMLPRWSLWCQGHCLRNKVPLCCPFLEGRHRCLSLSKLLVPFSFFGWMKITWSAFSLFIFTLFYEVISFFTFSAEWFNIFGTFLSPHWRLNLLPPPPPESTGILVCHCRNSSLLLSDSCDTLYYGCQSWISCIYSYTSANFSDRVEVLSTIWCNIVGCFV